MKKFILLLIITVLTSIGTNMAHPVTPYYIADLGFPDWTFGVFFAVMSLGMLLTAPLWGSLCDKGKYKFVLLIGCVMYSVGQVMFALFNNIPAIIFARFFSGCFSSAINVSLISYATESLDMKNILKSTRIASVISFQVIGGSLGNFAGGILGDYVSKYNQVILIQAIYLSLLGILIYIFINMNDYIEKENSKRKNALANLANVKKLNTKTIIFLITVTFISIVFTNVQKYLDIYLRDSNWTTGNLGTLNLVVGLLTFGVNIIITPFLLKKMKPLVVSFINAFIGGIAIFITFNLSDLSISLYSAYLIYIIAKAILEPSTVTYISNTKELDSGLILGVRQSFVSLGAIIGPLIAGILYESIKVYLFYICAIILLFASVSLLILAIYEKKHSEIIEE